MINVYCREIGFTAPTSARLVPVSLARQVMLLNSPAITVFNLLLPIKI